MKTRIILVDGVDCSGKSLAASYISQKYGIPIVKRDHDSLMNCLKNIEIVGMCKTFECLLDLHWKTLESITSDLALYDRSYYSTLAYFQVLCPFAKIKNNTRRFSCEKDLHLHINRPDFLIKNSLCNKNRDFFEDFLYENPHYIKLIQHKISTFGYIHVDNSQNKTDLMFKICNKLVNNWLKTIKYGY